MLGRKKQELSEPERMIVLSKSEGFALHFGKGIVTDPVLSERHEYIGNIAKASRSFHGPHISPFLYPCPRSPTHSRCNKEKHVWRTFSINHGNSRTTPNAPETCAIS